MSPYGTFAAMHRHVELLLVVVFCLPGVVVPQELSAESVPGQIEEAAALLGIADEVTSPVDNFSDASEYTPGSNMFTTTESSDTELPPATTTVEGLSAPASSFMGARDVHHAGARRRGADHPAGARLRVLWLKH